MNDDKVIPLRPRIARAVRAARGLATGLEVYRRCDEEGPMPVRIDPNVKMLTLMRALGSQGLTFKLEEYTGTVVIMPVAIARQEESEQD